MLHLEKVNGNNVWDILKLTVSKSQKNFVATNEISIIEAYTAITGNGHAFPFGIYDEDKPVGFLMIGFDVDDYWTDAPEIAKGNYNLWRLMIDKAYQNRGYGKEAVSLALEFIKSMPCGERNTVGYHMNPIMQLPVRCIALSVSKKPVKWTAKN